MLLNCFLRGNICASCQVILDICKENQISVGKSMWMFLYGFSTFPIIFHNYKFCLQRICLPWQKFTSQLIVSSTINECILWPINVLPILYICKNKLDLNYAFTEYKEKVVPITLSSAIFWIPFTSFQMKYPISTFAPMRFSAGIVYNSILLNYN